MKDKYGYQWWLGPENYSARGLFGQFSFVFPRDDAVLAVMGAIMPGSNFTRHVFKHFPAMFRAGAAPANDRDLATLTARTRAHRGVPLRGRRAHPRARRERELGAAGAPADFRPLLTSTTRSGGEFTIAFR